MDTPTPFSLLHFQPDLIQEYRVTNSKHRNIELLIEMLHKVSKDS